MASAPSIYPRTEETFPGSLFGRPSRRSYRAAVKQIVLTVKARHRLSSEDLAEKIGVSRDTIDNAETETTSLEAVSLLNIGYFYGEEAIEPVRQLYLCRPVDELTIADRLDRIEREAAEIRRELS
jgi:DNA-binding XRE family transcriptional regulator